MPSSSSEHLPAMGTVKRNLINKRIKVLLYVTHILLMYLYSLCTYSMCVCGCVCKYSK